MYRKEKKISVSSVERRTKGAINNLKMRQMLIIAILSGRGAVSDPCSILHLIIPNSQVMASGRN